MNSHQIIHNVRTMITINNINDSRPTKSEHQRRIFKSVVSVMTKIVMTASKYVNETTNEPYHTYTVIPWRFVTTPTSILCIL